MRAPVHKALLVGAAWVLLGCSPKTAGPGTMTQTTHKLAAGAAAGGAGGMGGAGGKGGVGGIADVSLPAPSTGQGGSLAVATTPPMAAEPNAAGPSAALVRLEPFAHKPPMAGAVASSKPVAGASGAAGVGAARPPLAASGTMQAPPPELCAQLQRSVGMRQLPPNDRLLALLAACTVVTQGGAAGTAAQGGSHANAGDVPDERTPATLAGTAVFTHVPEGLSLVIVLDGCKDGALYPVHIHAGHSCADGNGIGEHWDRTRGDDIPDLRCNGSHASQEYVRDDSADKPWSLGGPSTSDVVGHALVLDDPEDRTLPIACGVVTAP